MSPILVLISLASCEWLAFTFRASTGVWSLPASLAPAATQLLVSPANAQESSSRKIRNLEIESLPTLRVGDEASEVAKLQTNLQKLGYYQGEITNTFNQATQEALIQFQEDSDITADGIAGPNTWKTLLVTAAASSDTASESDTTANQDQTENTEDSQQEQQAESQQESDTQSDEKAQSQSNGNWNEKLSRIALLVVGGIFGIGAFAGLFFILLKLSGGENEEFETSPPGSGKSGSNQFSSTASASTTNPFATTETETSKGSPSEAHPPTSSPTPAATTEASQTEQQKTSVSSSETNSETSVASPSPSLESATANTQTNGKSNAEFQIPPDEAENLEQWSSQESSQSATSISKNQPSQLAKINIVEELIKELQAPDPVKRRKAIWELGQQGDSRAVYPLLNLMLESDSKQQGLILAAMSEIGTRVTHPLNQALVMALQADKPEVRKNAIRDLMRVYDSFGEVSHLLSHAHHDPDPQVQETAQWAISKLHRLRAIAQGDIPSFSRRFPSEEISLPSPVQQVVNVMLFRGEVTLEEAAECTGYERDTVEKMLEPLVKQKIIARYEGEEGIYYRLCAQNPDTK